MNRARHDAQVSGRDRRAHRLHTGGFDPNPRGGYDQLRTDGDVAQLGEHLLCKEGVRGSSPLISTTSDNRTNVLFW